MTEQEMKIKSKEFVDSLSEQELTSLKTQFRVIVDEFVDKEILKKVAIQNQINEFESELKEIRLTERELTYADSAKREELWKRKEVLQGLISIRIEQLRTQDNIVNAISHGGSISELTDKLDFVHKNIPDFRLLNTNNIEFSEDEILTATKPIYIPFIDEEKFARKGYLFDAIRISKDSYLLCTTSYKDGISAEYVQPYVIVTLDQLVLTLDYYYKKAKANAVQEAKARTKRQEEYYDKLPESRRSAVLMQRNYYSALPVIIKKKITENDWNNLNFEEREKLYKPFKRYGASRLTSKLSESTMWVSFHSMYERFINPEAIRRNKEGLPDKNGRYANPEVFKYWTQFRQMMEFKILDIKMQRLDYEESYKKALETSFGESNVNDILKDKYGILVKRQNGDSITAFEINQIDTAFGKVQNTFGNLKPNCLKYNIKISHSGKKQMFAMKAIGVYIPQMGTIGVSEKYGEKQFESTLSHELAHFIDNFIGELNNKRWATDDYESSAGIIAFTFRNNMNKPSKDQGEYINATKECFARAFQQYFGIKIYGDNATVVTFVSGDETDQPIYNADNFVSKFNFETKIIPLIEDFLYENKDVFQTTVDLDETNEIPVIGNELPMDVIEPVIETITEENPKITEENISDLIDGLEVLTETMEGIEKQEIEDVIEGLKLLI